MTDFDDQLRDELDRRASSVQTGRDWARHGLLPGVLNGIETRPGRVATPRAPAFAGLAAAFAILVVLVIALPRVGPSSSSPRPTDASPPSTIHAMGTTAFAARLATGELNGQTLLISGEVVVEARRGPLCPISPNNYCYVGTLAGSDIDLFARPIPTLEGEGTSLGGENENPVWDSWRMPSPPEGVHRQLAVTVTENGTVRLLGYTPQDELATTVGEFEFLDVDAASPDEVRVVPGWLAGMDIRECPAAEPYPGLPGRACDPSWIADSSTGARDGALLVQDEAYFDYAADQDDQLPPPPNASEPRAGAYVVAKRLEGSGCPAESPCWQWEVIGRLTINDDAPAQPVATPSTFVCDADPTADPFIVDTSQDKRPVVIDSTGLVDRCEAVAPTARNQSGVFVENPDGDLRTLLVNWSGNPCDLASTFTFGAVVDGFELNGRRPNVGCREPLVHHAIRIHLNGDIDAATVRGSLPPDGPTAEPAREIACEPGGEFAHIGAPRIADETGLVVSCSVIEGTGSLGALIEVRNPDFNLDRFEVIWPGTPCDIAIPFEFSLSSDEYELNGRRPDVDCEAMAVTHAIVVQLSGEIDAALVEAKMLEPRQPISSWKSRAPMCGLVPGDDHRRNRSD